MSTHRTNPERIRRSRIFYTVFGFFVSLVGLFVLLALQSLVLPALIGMLAAYIFMPALDYLQRQRIHKALSVMIIFAMIILMIFGIGRQVTSIIPDENQMLELRVSVQHKLNEQYLSFFGLESYESTSGNMMYNLVGGELSDVMGTLNNFLALKPSEEALLMEYIASDSDTSGTSKRVLEYLEENKKLPFLLSEEEEPAEEVSDSRRTIPDVGITTGSSRIGAFLAAISNWIIFPFVFIFLLVDEGQIKKSLISLIPNRYFEMALTTIDNVDTAIGNYLRGTLLECSLVGITFIIGLLLVGFEFQAAVMIGIIAGLANAIPFLGPVIGLIVGLLYALVVDVIDPLIPFLIPDNPIIGVILVVAIAQGMDNVVYQPLVLGKAVNLHPLVVILGVTGGSVIFGFAGMLFAIPAIVVLSVITSTLIKQLRAYFIIY